MKLNRFIVIGLGKVGMGLLEKLPKDYDVLCIDKTPDVVDRVRAVRPDNTSVLQADATSRLILEEARVNEAEAVIITTTTERVTLEVARLLREHFQPRRVIAVGITTDGMKRLAEMGTEVQDLFAASAAGIRGLLEQRTRSATTIGMGKNEILEVEVHPHSRLANKPLRGLAPLRWRIGIIYRDGNIVVPRPDTVLRPKDHVVVLGDPAVLKTVSDIMTFNFEKFPLEYGAEAVAFLAGREDKAFFTELEYLVSVFPLERVRFVYTAGAVRRAAELSELINRDCFRSVEERTVNRPLHVAAQELSSTNLRETGLVILSGTALERRPVPAVGRVHFRRLALTAACPVLIARGTHPYERSVVPAAEGLEPHHTLETALEMATTLNNEVSVLFAEPMRYIAASGTAERDYEAMRKTVSELSLVYRTGVRTTVLTGNPVRAVLGSLPGYQLLLIDSSSLGGHRWPASLLSPDAAWHLVRRAPASTLLVPPMEEAL